MKEYEGTCYIGVVGPEIEIGDCRDSILRMTTRQGDEGPFYIRATKGYEARQRHMEDFLKSKHDFIVLLDHDQTFPADTLERLRNHKLPYVSGYYLRRQFAPILPVWYYLEDDPEDFPMRPWTEEPERGKLYGLGASGWGCILIHREVVESVQKLLKGEDLVIEDDMDVYPYDLGRIMEAIRGLNLVVSLKPSDHQRTLESVGTFTKVLTEEIQPLRCLKSQIGSDIRFPFYARKAGYILMGDPDVRCGHMLNYPLSPDDYSLQKDDYRTEWKAKVEKDRAPEAETIRSLRQDWRAI